MHDEGAIRRVVSGIVHMIRSGARWRDCPPEYGPYTTVYNRFNRWNRQGVWSGIFYALKGRSDVVTGAIVGTAAALLLLSNRTVSAGQLGLPLHVTPELAAGATLFALAIGLVAGAAPVLRAASLPVAGALRRN